MIRLLKFASEWNWQWGTMMEMNGKEKFIQNQSMWDWKADQIEISFSRKHVHTEDRRDARNLGTFPWFPSGWTAHSEYSSCPIYPIDKSQHLPVYKFKDQLILDFWGVHSRTPHERNSNRKCIEQILNHMLAQLIEVHPVPSIQFREKIPVILEERCAGVGLANRQPVFFPPIPGVINFHVSQGQITKPPLSFHGDSKPGKTLPGHYAISICITVLLKL